MPPDLTVILGAGLLSTLAMDLASHGLTLAGVYRAPVNTTVIGRWVGHQLAGTFRHEHIARARPLRHEASLGALAHYAIGVVLALVYATSLEWSSLTHSLTTAAGFGLLSSALPWFWLFPSCGFGYFGLKGDRLLLSSLVNHLVFGVALFSYLPI